VTVRFGVVGTAFWAEQAHLPGLRSVADVRLVGLWGRNAQRAGALVAAQGLQGFDSFEHLLGEVDAVSFAVPPAVQADLALQAARAGKHLLLEKSVAFDPATADAIVAELGMRGLASVVFLMRRFIPEMAAAIARLRGRRWDRAEVSVMGRALIPGSPYETSQWRREPRAVLWDLGPHVLSILIPVLGPIRRLTLVGETDSATHLTSEHDGSGVADIQLSQRAPPGHQGNLYRFNGPDGTVTLPEPPINRPAIFGHAVRDLLRAIASGELSACDARFGAEITWELARATR
jgi:predicted dehydrogenase